MHLFVLALFLGVFLQDTPGVALATGEMSAAWRVGCWLLPKVGVWALYASLCAVVLHRLAKIGALRWVTRLDRATVVYRFAALGLYGYDLRVGVLRYLRSEVLPEGWPLLAELFVLTPPLLMIFAAWWSYYPIDRRLRQDALIRQLDSGQTVYPIWTRGQYLLAQFRHQMAIMIVPLLLMLGWYEVVDLLLPEGAARRPMLHGAATAAGVGGVFLLSPVMIRCIWDTTALPPGEVRARLTELCAQYRVGFRELLLWRTFGGMVNAAVMGVVAPVRFILLSDALLDNLRAEQVEAVMAHEVAHVRKHHLVWLVLVAGAMLAALQTLTAMAAEALTPMLRDAAAVRAASMGAAVGLWVLAFGWVSRRFERQADCFAVAHLAQRHALSRGEVRSPVTGQITPAPSIDAPAIDAMIDALHRVARLNHIPLHARSWRHGSIATRQTHLRALLGRPVDDLPIDRTVNRINFAGLVLVAGLIVLGYFVPITPLLF